MKSLYSNENDKIASSVSAKQANFIFHTQSQYSQKRTATVMMKINLRKLQERPKQMLLQQQGFKRSLSARQNKVGVKRRPGKQCQNLDLKVSQVSPELQ